MFDRLAIEKKLAKAEEALKRANERLNKFMNSANDGFYLFDSELNLVEINKNVLEYYPGNTEKKDLIGQHILAIAPDAKETGRYDQYTKVMLTGKPYFTDGIVHHSQFGDRHLSIKAFKVGDGLGTITTDITERKLMEGRLRSLASQLVLAQEQERRRLAMDLHDSIGQLMVTCKIKLGQLREMSTSADCKKLVEDVSRLYEQMIQETRSLTFQLSPPVLHELGFEPALKWLIEHIQKEYDILIDLESEKVPKSMGAALGVLLFRTVQELLMNVVKHAKARHIRILLKRDDNNVYISVQDDGCGFNLASLSSSTDKMCGFGFFSIRERLRYLGGKLKIKSQPGQGTEVTLIVPLKMAEIAPLKMPEIAPEKEDEHNSSFS